MRFQQCTQKSYSSSSSHDTIRSQSHTGNANKPIHSRSISFHQNLLLGRVTLGCSTFIFIRRFIKFVTGFMSFIRNNETRDNCRGKKCSTQHYKWQAVATKLQNYSINALKTVAENIMVNCLMINLESLHHIRFLQLKDQL